MKGHPVPSERAALPSLLEKNARRGTSILPSIRRPSSFHVSASTPFV
jgi:hypothetical protein